MRKPALAIGLTVLLLLVGLSFPVGGQQVSETFMTLPIDTTISVKEGRVIELARVTSDSLQGQTCEVTAIATNDESVHPGNKLTIISGNSSIELFDVEEAETAITSAEKSFTFDDDVIVALTMGADEEFSAGLDVSVNCDPPEEACQYDEALLASDPKCFEPCEYDELIPSDSVDCAAPLEEDVSQAAEEDTTPVETVATGKVDDDLPTTGPTSTTLLAVSAAAIGYAYSRYRQLNQN